MLFSPNFTLLLLNITESYKNCDGIDNMMTELKGNNFKEKYIDLIKKFKYKNRGFGIAYTPKEFMKNNYKGVCRDFTKSVCCLANKYNIKTRLLLLTNENITLFNLLFNNSSKKGHIVCEVNVNNKWYVFDMDGIEFENNYKNDFNNILLVDLYE
ncbi:MAG: transglutaminase-like domain-containing protein [Methanosarcinales archaeon]